jgi:hypothetical protein
MNKAPDNESGALSCIILLNLMILAEADTFDNIALWFS